MASNLSGSNTGDQDLSGLVPYVGASGNVDIGIYDFTTTGTVTTGNINPISDGVNILGSSNFWSNINTYDLNSVNQIYANAITATGNITGSSFIKSGGLSSEFLKADGSVDSSTYLTSQYWDTATGGINYAGGYVGIGTSTPSAKLDVWGNLSVGTSSTPALFVNTATGNVGIGITAPTSKIEILTTDDSQPTLSITRTTTNVQNKSLLKISSLSNVTGTLTRDTDIHLQNNNNTNNNYTQIGNFNSNSTVNSSIDFLNIDHSYSGAIRFLTRSALVSYGERMRITETGNVGIGTTTPAAKLDIWGNLQVGTSSTPTLFVNTATGKIGIGTASSEESLHVTGNIRADGGMIKTSVASITFVRSTSVAIHAQMKGLYLGGTYYGNTPDAGEITTNTESLTLSPGNNTAVTITTTGNVGIGTTTPGVALSVIGNAQFTAIDSGTFSQDINITADGTLTTSASDIRLKQNIQLLNASSTLEKLLLLEPSSFEWKDTGTHDVGLIAQSVEKIFPELVFTNKTDGYKGINYSRLPALLVSGMQEIVYKIGEFKNIVETKLLKTDKVETKELCIDDLCITKDQLQTLLNENNVITSPTIPDPIIPLAGDGTDGTITSDTPLAIEAPITPEEPPVVEEPAPEPTPVSGSIPETPSEPPVVEESVVENSTTPEPTSEPSAE